LGLLSVAITAVRLVFKSNHLHSFLVANLGLLNQEESAGAVNERQQTPLSTLHPPLTFPTVKKLNFRQWQLAG
jgi:hypothetical protein